jgi:hypothetical protein
MIYIENYIRIFFNRNYYLLEKHLAGKETVKIEYQYVLGHYIGNYLLHRKLLFTWKTLGGRQGYRQDRIQVRSGTHIGNSLLHRKFYLLEKHLAGKDTVKIEYKYVLERPKGNSFEPVYPFFSSVSDFFL